jgi:putative sterol carrier protein
MAKKETGSKKAALTAIEASLTALSRKLEGAAQLKHGTILLRFTDSGEECCVEGTGREARVTRAAPATPPLVQVSGTSATLKAIMDGKREAAKAFAAGGIQVQGDVMYLEGLLKHLGLLQCE